MSSLYETWLGMAREHGSENALHDVSSGESWTFKQLLAEGERRVDESAAVVFPQGHEPAFIFSVIRAWRNDRAVCPVEPSQTVPAVTGVPDWCQHLKLTSATTGSPKCIAFTAAQLAADAANIVSTMGLRRDWPNIGCISLAHSYGFSNLVTPLLLHGIPLVIVPAPLPEMILRAARLLENATIPAVPALWRTWLESRSLPKNLKLAISAGAPLALDLEQEIFSTTGLKVHNFYGSSECGGIAYDRSRIPRTKSNYAGTCMDNVAVSLSDAGTLVVEGSAVAESYWPEAQLTLAARRFETSDLADVIQGRIYLRGRASDIINVAGRKVLPETIEAALRAHPLVRECAVFGIPDSLHQRFERIVACVNAVESLKIPEIAAFLSKNLPPWQIPREWWFTTDLVANQRGKIPRAEWRRRFFDAQRGVGSSRP